MTPYNNNAVYVKTPVKVYSLKGDNVPILLSDIIKEFEHSNDIDSVILNLSDKYSLISLQKMLDFLIENRFLIESLSLEQEVYHDNFAKQIEFFSTFKANPKKIIEQFNHISLGIICSDSLADELLSSVVESGLYSNISIANIDNKNYEFKREEKKQAKIAI
ncbi:MAG TPA: hypothetical protein DHV55_11490, partial [Clostridiaceae bacterium]|nr:hypothetical protein [Clostridiaceae bacterium]